MAFKVPTFNAWLQCWRYVPAGSHYELVGYCRCQVRGPDSHWEGPVETSAEVYFQVLIPTGTDIRSGNLNLNGGVPDLISVGGWGRRLATVQGVSPKGAGFSNEYTILVCYFQDASTGFSGIVYAPINGLPRVNTTLTPPLGYTPIPVITPSGLWSVDT